MTRDRRLGLVKVLVFLLAGAFSGAASADAWTLIPDGAPVYGVLRWGTLLQTVQKAGWTQLPEYEEFKRSAGNVDVLNPAIYTVTGIDINAPIVAMAEGGPMSHLRVVARYADKGLFLTVVSGVAEDKSSGITMAPSSSPAGKAGVIASGKLGKWTGILRLDGDQAVLDLVTGALAKATPPAALAAKFPVKPVKPFVSGPSARAILTAEKIAALYVDGKKIAALGPLWAQILPPDNKALPLQKCTVEMNKLPTTFDEMAASLSVTDKAPELEIVWGAAGGTPLKFEPLDDGVVNLQRLRRESVAHLGVYGANVQPFRGLKTTGLPPMGKIDSLIDQCPTTVAPTLLIRSWPHLIAAGLGTLDKNPQDLGPLAGVVSAVNQLRSLFFALRTVPDAQNAPNWVAVISANEQFRTVVEGLLGIFGLTSASRTVGTHRVAFYDGTASQGPMKFVAAIETLANKAVGVTGAASEESLKWAFGTEGQKAVSGAGVPLASAHMDGSLLQSFNKNPEDQKYLRSIKRLSAEVRSDELFRAILRLQFN